MNVITQKSSDKLWKDEGGFEIPYSRTTQSERLMERKSGKLFKSASSLNEKLSLFKNEVRAICTEVYEKYMEEQNSDKKHKGNFTWYNFNRSIKVEVSVNERIEFDDLGIIACKDKLDEFLSNKIESKDEFIKQMLMDAFETSRGNLDTKKVMNLLRYRSKISAKAFQEALDLIEKSIRRPDSKTYFRIWAKNAEGKYQNLDLNFSSIE